MGESKKPIQAVCNFCGQKANIEKGIQLIQGQGTYICSECICEAYEMVEEAKNQNNKKNKNNVMKNGFKPSEVIEFLDKYVVGQERAKSVLAIAIYNHYKMLKYKSEGLGSEDVEIEKSNILMAGPTGSGKTYIIKSMAKMLNVPFAISDATSLTASGYVGEDVENVVRKLIEAADGDIEKAQTGIIYIDEIDKNSRKGENPSITRDVGGESVQQALLKIVEGSEIEVAPKGSRKHPLAETMKIDTTNILFIIGGSFEGIEKIIEKRLKQDKTSSMGFNGVIESKKSKKFNELIHDLKVEDLQKHGMIPELLGRFPVICTLDELDREALIKILTEPKNAITKQYKALFEMDGIDLDFTKEALESIADIAIQRKTGARALRGIMEDVLRPTMLKAPEMQGVTKITITKEVVEVLAEPIVEIKEIS